MTYESTPLKNCVVLYIPLINDITVEKISDKLSSSFRAFDLHTELLYLPFGPTRPASFIPDMQILVKVPETMVTLQFIENKETATAAYYMFDEVLLLPVKLLRAEHYPHDFLAGYFKRHWQTSITL